MIMLWAGCIHFYALLDPCKKHGPNQLPLHLHMMERTFARRCWYMIVNWLHCGKTVLLLYITTVSLYPGHKNRELEKYALHFHYHMLMGNPHLRKHFK